MLKNKVLIFIYYNICYLMLLKDKIQNKMFNLYVHKLKVICVPLTISTSSNGIFISNLYLFASKLLTTLFGEAL